MALPSPWVLRRLRRQAAARRRGPAKQPDSRLVSHCPLWAQACDDLQDLTVTCLAAVGELEEFVKLAGARATDDAADLEDDMALFNEELKAMAPSVAAATALFQTEVWAPDCILQLPALEPPSRLVAYTGAAPIRVGCSPGGAGWRGRPSR